MPIRERTPDVEESADEFSDADSDGEQSNEQRWINAKRAIFRVLAAPESVINFAFVLSCPDDGATRGSAVTARVVEDAKGVVDAKGVGVHEGRARTRWTI